MNDDMGMDFLQYLRRECGYKPIARSKSGDRYAAISEQLYLVRLIVGRWDDRAGYSDCWDYAALGPAIWALAEWHKRDFEGEPLGWIRHPGSGRRVSQSADEYDDEGHRVGAVSVPYVRR